MALTYCDIYDNDDLHYDIASISKDNTSHIFLSQWKPSHLVLMQDGSSSHSAFRTMAELKQDDMTLFNILAFSLDMKLIVNVWNLMKYFIGYKYPDLPDGKECTNDELSGIIKEVWDNTKSGNLVKLVAFTLQSSQAVRDAGVGVTNY